MRHFITIDDLSNVEIMDILRTTFELTNGIVRDFDCQGKEMLGLFFEPSTRTRLSFEMAMHRLGGRAMVVSDVQNTSLAKGETLADTARVVSGYGYDFIVVRHPWDGAAQVMADYSLVPVINAGDGSHQHPTQTLVDLYTIRDYKGHLNNLRVGLLGDLRYGRTVHSLAIALARFEAATIVCIPVPGLEMPDWVVNRVCRSQTIIIESHKIEEVINSLDVLYLTRVQKERLPKEKYSNSEFEYLVDAELLKQADKDLLILHPLPRTDELAREIDNDPRAKYFQQSDNGVPVRMALIAALLGRTEMLESRPEPKCKTFNERCANPRCVTAYEDYVEPRFSCLPANRLACFYCGHIRVY